MKISKSFLNYCWNFGFELGIPQHNLTLQEYRYCLFLFSLNNGFYKIKRDRESYLKMFSYKEEGKIHYLMNRTQWKTFNFECPKELFILNGFSKEEWNKNRKKELELARKGKIDLHSIRPEYIERNYISIKDNIIEKIRISSLNEIKLFHYICWHKSRGPYPIIKTDLNDIITRTMMGNSPYKLKRRLTLILNKFKEIGFIKNYKWGLHGVIEIEK